MKEQKFLVSEVKNLIKKIKQQDFVFGQYLEDNIILDKDGEYALYIGQEVNLTPHLPLIVE